jgi:hypothetical protein
VHVWSHDATCCSQWAQELAEPLGAEASLLHNCRDAFADKRTR